MEESAYLDHASVLRMAVHHVIEGREKVPQRLHEIGLSVVLVETGRGGRKEIHWQMITKLLFVSSLETGTPAVGRGWGGGFAAKSLSSWQNRQHVLSIQKGLDQNHRRGSRCQREEHFKRRQHSVAPN